RRMWELARDIALDRPPVPKDLASSVTPAGAPSLLSEIPFDTEALILRMMGVLVIEVFAIEAFRWAREVLGDRTLFRRHDEARTLIEYIQEDETPHVGYLATSLAGLRCRRLACVHAAPVPGEYLEQRYPEPRLMPVDPVARARCRALELVSDTQLDACVFVLALVKGGEKLQRRFPEALPRAAETLAKHHANLERDVAGREYFLGEVSLADVAIYPHLRSAVFLGYPIPD